MTKTVVTEVTCDICVSITKRLDSYGPSFSWLEVDGLDICLQCACLAERMYPKIDAIVSKVKANRQQIEKELRIDESFKS